MSAISIEQIKRLAEYLSPEDKLLLAELLVQQAGNVAPRPKPQSLRGAWQNVFPPDLDLDAELREEMNSKGE
jgi:hypothetical protein